jgi:Bacterial Ig domain
VTWNTTTATAGIHALTAVARDGAGLTATSNPVQVTVTHPSGGDTTPPTVTLTAPATGNVSGTVTVSANATDNVGVVGVQFRLNGANLGNEDTTTPYSVSWNTATAAAGNHTLTAVARDATGLSTTSTGVSVTVQAPPVVDLNCTGPWTGSEETTNITAWPYRDCFRTNPVSGGRTYTSLGTGGETAWEQGTGWNGQNALRVRSPDGSTGNHQGYAGLGGHNFHAVRTKRLNIRYLLRYNSNFARYSQSTKWEIAIKYDYSNPSSPVRLQGCERGITVSDADPQNTSRKRFIMQQGVCTEAWNALNLNGFNYGPDVRENEWISVENEFDLETGLYRTYITTQDGVYNQSLTSEVNIGTGASAEVVPNPHWWGSIDCSAGCFWDWANLGTVPRPVDTYIWFSHFVMSNNRIGPPAGFVQ